MVESTRPSAPRRRIESVFARACRKHNVRPRASRTPSAARLLWRLGDENLGKIDSACERVAREAAALGYLELGLATVAARWQRGGAA